jgi:hypothetical protein
LREAESARVALERRLNIAEHERDRLAAWKANAQEQGAPGVQAERRRALAIQQGKDEAVRKEAERWQGLAEQCWPTIEHLVRLHTTERFIYDHSIEALIGLFGSRFGLLMHEVTNTPVNRDTRRNVATKAETGRTLRKAKEIARREGGANNIMLKPAKPFTFKGALAPIHQPDEAARDTPSETI